MIKPDLLKASINKVTVGQSIKRDDFIEWLVLSGFEFNTQADQVGLFSKRGSLVDVWSTNQNKPLRFEFDSQTLIKISEINSITKKLARLPEASARREKNLNQVELLPIKIDSSIKTTLDSYLTKTTILINSDSSLLNYADLNIKESPKFTNQLNRFAKEFALLQNQNKQIIILTQKTKALTELFKENKIVINESTIIYSLTNQLPEVTYGFNSPDDKVLVLTDYDIFGFNELKNPTKRKVDKTFIAQLKIGDYVVHADHGIAKFTGMTKAKVDEFEREYFVLSYLGNDKLYLPVDQADKIDKYIGTGKPKIHSLGKTSTWPQIVRKIKEDTIKTAKELINLYAQRQLSESQSFKNYPEEEVLTHDFPFEETPDQLRTLYEVMHDLKKITPADRLICGDVGFGKTEIAIRASFKAALNGLQTVILCPTTILAQQHEDTFKDRLKKFPVKVASLSRFQSKKEQTKIITELKSGQVDIVIGTHRLLSNDISLKNLGLLIIDEEQRFGVKHKEQLKKLKAGVHVLTLTATPIPRTLHFSLTGVRDISVIETAPEGRLPIKTEISPFTEELVKKVLKTEILRGGQAYYLYNDVQTIGLKAKKIQSLLPQAKIGIAHGQLPEGKLAEVMHDFDTRKIDILICSTIIENGLDLPNVNTLVVENSPKFGLGQLYQLRGRVGRGHKQAYAYFLYHSEKLPGKAGERLRALQEATELGSGFQLAMRDMEIRGAGNILGKKQHGKVSAIGLTLYQQLLEQTVEEIKTGIIPEPVSDISIDLPLKIGIPESFEPKEQKRLQLYQKLARLNSIDELNEYFKKFSPTPSELSNFFKVLELKILALKTDIISIDSVNSRGLDGQLKSKIILTFKTELDYKKVSKLLENQPDWQDSETKLKIEKYKLGDNWLEKLKQAISFFIKKSE